MMRYEISAKRTKHAHREHFHIKEDRITKLYAFLDSRAVGRRRLTRSAFDRRPSNDLQWMPSERHNT